jgi:hypothetical protein
MTLPSMLTVKTLLAAAVDSQGDIYPICGLGKLSTPWRYIFKLSWRGRSTDYAPSLVLRLREHYTISRATSTAVATGDDLLPVTIDQSNQREESDRAQYYDEKSRPDGR